MCFSSQIAWDSTVSNLLDVFFCHLMFFFNTSRLVGHFLETSCNSSLQELPILHYRSHKTLKENKWEKGRNDKKKLVIRSHRHSVRPSHSMPVPLKNPYLTSLANLSLFAYVWQNSPHLFTKLSILNFTSWSMSELQRGFSNSPLPPFWNWSHLVAAAFSLSMRWTSKTERGGCGGPGCLSSISC